MPFGLKNTEASYQRLVDKAFQKQIGRNLEDPKSNKHEAKSQEMHLWGGGSHVLGIKGKYQRDKDLPTLTAPMEKEEHIVYLAVAREAESAVLMTERETKQMPVYFVSRALQVTTTKVEDDLPDPWTLLTDGSSCIDGFGAGLILTNPKGTKFSYALRFRFDATNNEAEYEALIAGLRITEQIGVRNIQTHVDSRLMANQINGSYIAKEPVEELNEKSINEAEVLAFVEEEGDIWMTPIYEYLMEETLLAEKEKARVIRRKSRRYAVINRVLYKKSYLGLWLRYVRPLQENYVFREIHEGSCSMHAGTRSMVAKAIWTGYYWPTMHANARKMIRECQDCQ
ncbi:reverse transcriptase domain-containing protein, partial [Tanacetum coccineum]